MTGQKTVLIEIHDKRDGHGDDLMVVLEMKKSKHHTEIAELLIQT